jgi:hypothetical protein
LVACLVSGGSGPPPFMSRKLIRHLPELPEDVLALIWFWIRVDLRPRMKRYGPLLRDIRGTAGTRIAQKYGMWLFMAHHYEYSSDIPPEFSIICAWRFLALPKMNFVARHTVQNDNDLFTMTTMIIKEDDKEAQAHVPLRVERRCKKLWLRIPEPVILRCPTCSCSPILEFGPPLRTEEV